MRKPNLARALAELARTNTVTYVAHDGTTTTISLDEYLTTEPPTGIVRATVRDAQATAAKTTAANLSTN